MKSNKVSEVYVTKEDYVWGIAVSGNRLLYAASPSSFTPSAKHVCYDVDLSTGKKTVLDLPVHISGSMALWKNTLYCLGWTGDERGVYAINLKTKQYSLLYPTSQDGFINGITMGY